MSTQLQEFAKSTWRGEPGSWRDDPRTPSVKQVAVLTNEQDPQLVQNWIKRQRAQASVAQPGEMSREVNVPGSSTNPIEIPYIDSKGAQRTWEQQARLVQPLGQQALMGYKELIAPEPIENTTPANILSRNMGVLKAILRFMDGKYIPADKTAEQIRTDLKTYAGFEDVYFLPGNPLNPNEVLVFVGITSEGKVKVGLTNPKIEYDMAGITRIKYAFISNEEFEAEFNDFLQKSHKENEIEAFLVDMLRKLNISQAKKNQWYIA